MLVAYPILPAPTYLSVAGAPGNRSRDHHLVRTKSPGALRWWPGTYELTAYWSTGAPGCHNSYICSAAQTLDRTTVRRTRWLHCSFAPINRFFEHCHSYQCTQYTSVLDPCLTPDPEEKLIYYEAEEHVVFLTLVSYSFEVEYGWSEKERQMCFRHLI